MNGILDSQMIRPSLESKNPKDVRHGEGQYFSDIKPGVKSSKDISVEFKNVPNLYLYNHYIAVDVTGLDIKEGRENVFVNKTTNNLDISQRLVGWGKN